MRVQRSERAGGSQSGLPPSPQFPGDFSRRQSGKTASAAATCPQPHKPPPRPQLLAGPAKHSQIPKVTLERKSVHRQAGWTQPEDKKGELGYQLSSRTASSSSQPRFPGLFLLSRRPPPHSPVFLSLFVVLWKRRGASSVQKIHNHSHTVLPAPLPSPPQPSPASTSLGY